MNSIGGQFNIGCPDCGERWMYTLSPFDDSGCPTCGVSVAYNVSRECIRCRVPQPLTHSHTEYNVPQEFSSPEWDEWFDPRWESERPKRDAQEAQSRARRKKEIRDQAATKAAESFLPPEYRKGDNK